MSAPVNAPPVIGLRSRRALWGTAALVAASAGAAILYGFDPAHYAFYPRCLLHTTTGLHCPGCGALRGAHEFLHGRWLTALRLNPFVFGLLPCLFAVWLGRRWRAGQPLRLNQFQLSASSGWWFLGALLAFSILRNIPAYPFTFLAP